MYSDELFSDDSRVPEDSRAANAQQRLSSGNKLGVKGVGRLLFGLVLLIGTFTGLTAEAVLTAAPAFAAGTYTCSTPASGGTAATFYTGVTNTENVACYGVSGVTGTSAYPASISVNTGALPSGASQGTSTSSSPACVQSTTGSGTTEEYILTCAISDNPTPSQVGAGPGTGGTYPISYTANPGTDGGTATNSGTLTITVSNTTQTCIDPATAGTSAKFIAGYTNTYTVECENETHVSGQSEYPSSIALTSGTGPADAPVTFATSTSSSPACTTTTSGSGTTEEYILECGLSFAPTIADAGTGYPFTFTPTTNGVAGSTSGTLTITPGTQTMACTAPASGGTSTTWGSSAGGTNNSYSVACYGEVASTGVSGVTPYPTSIVPTTPANLPADLVSATSTSSTPACTKSTSGSGTTEEYILTCPQTEDSVSSDNGTYSSTFTASDSNSGGTATSGAWNLTVTGPADICTAPASGGTATTFKAGIANSYSVVCYGTGFASANAGNYPASITLNSGTLPADASEATSTSSSPACTQSTSGSGITEEYILTCPVTETPTAADEGTYGPITFSATPGANGGNTATTGPWTLTVGAAPAVTCIDPASGGTSSTFYENTSNSYTVECEAQSGVSGTTAYPKSLAINTGALPGDASQTFATSTSSSPACTNATSGSGTTEEYILECPLAATPTSSDAGSYPFTFTASGPGGVGSATSGTLTVVVTPPTTSCSTPASGGTSVSWVDGTAESETVTCYSEGYATSNAGNYPSSITLNSGTLPSGTTEATSTSSSPACTTATSGSGVTEEYELECKIADTPTPATNGSYPLTFLATGGANGAPNAVSGTLTVNVVGTAPTSHAGQYFNGIAGVPFCFDATTDTVTTANGGLPLTSIALGATPANTTNYHLQNVNLAAGTAQVCGTISAVEEDSTTTLAPVMTNSGGSVTESITVSSYGACTWTTTTANGEQTSLLDPNQDLYQTGSQASFGAPITGGVVPGSTQYYPSCTDAMFLGAGLGGAPTVNTANPFPTPTDSNPSAAQGALSSSNLDLGNGTAGTGGCWGTAVIGNGAKYNNFGTTAELKFPSPWVNGGDCPYGALGSNSAGGNTDTTDAKQPNDQLATCPPSQTDVNEGYVDCTAIASSGNNDSGANTSFNYSSDDIFFAGQPVPQQSTATLSAATSGPGDTVNISGGTNWWGGSGDAEPNTGPYGDTQIGAFYQVPAPSVYIGTSRATAVPVTSSVQLTGNSYACTGDIAANDTNYTTTNVVNPCTMTVGGPAGSFTVPSNLAPGAYNVYIDAPNTTPLPGNGPNDAYQTALGTNLGTDESVTPLTVEGLLVVKTSTTNYVDGGYSKAGDTINYNYAVTNTGPDTLTGIAVNDNLVPSADITCPDSSLGTGDSETCTGSYTTTQQDVDNGSVTNTATSSGIGPDSETVTSAPSSVTVKASDATSSLSLFKTASTTYADNGYGAAGDVINYNYAVTNTGTDSLSGIAVNDSLIPSADISCPNNTLAPTASENCNASYTVTQTDVDNGTVDNTATASGTSVDPNATTSGATSNPSTVDVAASDATSSLTLTKSTSSGGYSAAGDMIGYSYDVTNTGTDSLSGIAINDSLIPSADITCPSSTLAPQASESCTASYTVTAGDVTNGSVTNTATASGTSVDPNATTSGATSSSSSVTVLLTLLTLSKSTTSTGYGAAGDTIPYSYLVSNDTSGTLTGITVNDSLIPSADISCPDSTLAAGDSETCTATYTVTQADVDNGDVSNTATVSGVDSESVAVTSGSSTVTVLASYATSSLSLVKSASTTYADNGYGAAGDKISYSYDVTNTGTTTLTGIAISDNLVPTADITCPDSTLAPGASETCTATYTVLQSDVDNGSVTNTATASGTTLDPTTVTSNSSSVTVDASDATSSLSLTKGGPTSFSAAGQVLSYTYKVTNTGTETLSDVAVSDSLISYVDCPDSTLAPGASETCTASYTTTQEDVDNGSVVNTATASAKAPAGDGGATDSSNTSSVTVTYSGIVITTTSPLPAATIGTPYSDTFTVSGGNGGAPKWSAQSGLPKGLKLKASTGVLSGTVKSKVVPGTYTLTIEVKETHGGHTVEDVKFLSLPVQY